MECLSNCMSTQPLPSLPHPYITATRCFSLPINSLRRGKELPGQKGVLSVRESARGKRVRKMGDALLSRARESANGRLHDYARMVLM